ncbi:hypothetical protein HMF7854_04520 [Sphingomonas ginkgonis]|uniref:Uncharacterized protein n=1 Tax=Sphingomonas ginkgonis TaxID=2315330 RepID=A0A3R9YL01_9SPHN|nr:hypothetical protein [Sphingomonas ginkgonis]RST30173.1 hypothetical protein HMF7854_04520 [Sphingomonas ginkgonis]
MTFDPLAVVEIASMVSSGLSAGGLMKAARAAQLLRKPELERLGDAVAAAVPLPDDDAFAELLGRLDEVTSPARH